MTSAIRVLHVDDEPSFGELVADFLERQTDRVDVITESGAGAGLERLESEHAAIDCVVSDYDIYVEDDGDGIPPEHREEVFTPGFSTKGGSGIGMASVRQIVLAHEWSISIADSEAGGARFEIEDVERP